MAKASHPARYRAHGLLRRLARMTGLELPQFLAAAGLPPSLAAHPRPSLTAAQVVAAWETAEALLHGGLSPDTLRLDLRTRFSPAAFALAAAPDVGAGLRRWAELARFAQPAAATLEGTATLRFSGAPVLQAVALVQLLDALRMATARCLTPHHLALPAALPRRDEICAHAGVEASTEGEVRLSFAEADLGHAHVAPVQESWEDLDLSPPVYAAGIAQEVGLALPGLLAAGRPGAEAAAARLGLSKRTLQRRLMEAGQPYQAVLSATRQRLAQLYLAQPGLRMEEVALLLGFTDPNSFYRAYQGWTGTTPRAFRAAFAK
ncbi:MAG: helix-turn-helix transcriptional regulator [Pseudomonadota bacterium]